MGKQYTYQELLVAYNKLLTKNECLRKKIDQLQALLDGDNNLPKIALSIKQHLSLEKK